MFNEFILDYWLRLFAASLPARLRVFEWACLRTFVSHNSTVMRHFEAYLNKLLDRTLMCSLHDYSATN